MFESLFSPEMPLARFFLAFIIVLALIGGIAYMLRRFGAERLGVQPSRGRQPRLAVVDTTVIDNRRRLLLVRRDNVEHLLLLGGPTDLVVELNIPRPQTSAPIGASRDASSRAAVEPEPLAIPTPPTPGDGGLWPHPADLGPRLPSGGARAPQAEPTVRAPRAPIADPARATPQDPGALRPGAASELPPPPDPRRSTPIPAEETNRDVAARDATPRFERAPPLADRLGPALDSLPLQGRIPRPSTPPLAAPAEQPTTDQNLAEMAQRLEAALRRPIAANPERPARPPAPPTPASTHLSAEPANEPPATAERPQQTEESEAAVARKALSAQKPSEAEHAGAKAKADFHSLEMEMASLLGRPTEKT